MVLTIFGTKNVIYSAQGFKKEGVIMKSRAITIVKVLSLSVILSCLVFGLYAQNKFESMLATSESFAKYKTIPKKTTHKATKLAFFNEIEIIEEQKGIESWMLNLEIQKDDLIEESFLEEWMFDEYFWKVKTSIIDEEVIEETREIEEWMKNLKIVKKGSPKFFLNFREEQWMKKHAFLIL